MSGCLFCKIVSNEIPAKIRYENEYVIAFEDINPQAPIHLLIIPKQHIATLNELTEHHLIAELTKAGLELAKELNCAEHGYRLVMNCNEHGGQTVFHIHMHFLAGRYLTWPPG